MKSEKLINYIVNWLKDYAQKAGVNGFVVGVSGGIDSALTSTLCAKTMLPVWCIEMPIHQAESHISRAQDHIQYLKKQYANVHQINTSLTPVFESFRAEVLDNASPETVAMALANTRARLRMTTLYYYAGLYKLLVAGTGNKVEDFGIGFYTKYGDGGVDLSPIADLLKTEVYTLAKFLNIPNSIIMAQPSDGLFGDARSDEDQIGATYPELEAAMLHYNEGKSEVNLKGRALEVFNIYKRLHTQNQHKMNPIPVCQIPQDLKL